jgi:L-cystine transport system ATP-binding protein
MTEALLQVRGVKKSFGDLNVLRGIDLEVHEGEVAALIGPSGSGKTTLLRCVNFLEKADSGTIRLDGLEANFASVTAATRLALRRKTAMVFQNYALFQNKTVAGNIMEGLLVSKHQSRDEARAAAEKVLEKMGLADKADCNPSELSGGQQQRVGIARAIALNPRLILFDEPTSALDPEKVDEILDVIKEVIRVTGVTMLIVTHEMQFAYDVATRVIFMDGGEVVEQGTQRDVFDNPREDRTKHFLSRFNLRREVEYYL